MKRPIWTCNLWTSSTKFIGSFHDRAVGHSTQVLNEIPMGLNACEVIRSHRLMRSTDHLIPRHEHTLFAYLGHLRSKRFSGSLEFEMPNMIWYEVKLWDGQKCLRKTEKNKNEQKMDWFWFSVIKIPEWLIERAQISKNEINYVSTEAEAAISRNVGVPIFGKELREHHLFKSSRIFLNWKGIISVVIEISPISERMRWNSLDAGYRRWRGSEWPS